MTISVGGLALSDNLLLKGLRSYPVAIDVQRSEDGVAHVLVADMEGGRDLALEGYFTAGQVDALMAMARLKQPVVLVHPRGIFHVLITGSDLEEWIKRIEPSPSRFEQGSIFLLEV